MLALLHPASPGITAEGAERSAVGGIECAGYAGAGLDAFLRPELSVLVLALALALTGIVAGIALRIRAFLYAGVAFLVLNVIGQLLRFYPEQGLSRALILLGFSDHHRRHGGVQSQAAILRRIRSRRRSGGWE